MVSILQTQISFKRVPLAHPVLPKCHASKSTPLTLFPRSYEEAIQQAQNATQQALKDELNLLEVEFPTASLSSVSGDAEGANEMNFNMKYLNRYCRVFELMGFAESTRIFFPDQSELITALKGRAMDPSSGSAELSPVFNNSRFQLDFLMKPTGLMDFGIDLNKTPMAGKIKDTDKIFIAAYPHFNVDEILYVEELWRALKDGTKSIVVFNGELDRIRSGYYPSFFYPKIGKISKSFIPRFTQVYYIHNFKGSRPGRFSFHFHEKNVVGVLFRVYPEPWQVLKRDTFYDDQFELIQTLDQMPSLKEVALNILPRS